MTALSFSSSKRLIVVSHFIFPAVAPRSCGPSATATEVVPPRPCDQRPPAKQAVVYRRRSRVQRASALRQTFFLPPALLVVSHHYFFRKIGGGNLKMPLTWEINFANAVADEDCRRRPQSWGCCEGAIGVVDGDREVNSPTLRQPSTRKVVAHGPNIP